MADGCCELVVHVETYCGAPPGARIALDVGPRCYRGNVRQDLTGRPHRAARAVHADLAGAALYVLKRTVRP